MEPGQDKNGPDKVYRDGRGGEFRFGGRLARSRLIALFLIGVVLFNPPLLDAFDTPGTVFGLPGIILYMFAAWIAVIGLLALGLERRR